MNWCCPSHVFNMVSYYDYVYPDIVGLAPDTLQSTNSLLRIFLPICHDLPIENDGFHFAKCLPTWA
jgi:hypothetical protein